MTKKFKCTRPRTVTYSVVSLDVWGNARDGYEVNDAHYTGRTIDLPHEPTDDEIIACLKEDGEINKPVRRKFFQIEGDEDIYINYKGRPELELRKKD